MPYKNKEDLKACRKRNYHKTKIYQENYQQINKEKIAKQQRLKHIRRFYNLEAEDYFVLINKQENKCAICNQYETCKNKNGDIRPLCVDHCHTTGKVRGLLCNHCNSMLGNARDNIDVLLNGIKYLKDFS